MARKIVGSGSGDPGDSTHYGTDDIGKINQLLSGTDQSGTDAVTTNTTWTATKFTTTALVQSSYEDFTRIAAPGNPAANFGRIYCRQIDANNDGLFILLKKAGAYVEVQIA
jgi:hypothetical protein